MTEEELAKWRHALGLWIRYHRSAKGLTQKKLAKLIQISAPTMSLWECGDLGITAAHLKKIEVALGVEIFKPFLLE